MMFLRPILSDSQPKKMKNGVPMTSEMRDQHVGDLIVELERDLKKEQRVELARVPDHALAGRGAEQREQHELAVASSWRSFGERRLGGLAFALDLLEHRRLFQLEPDVDREDQQEQRNPERDAPAPLGELFLGDVATGTAGSRSAPGRSPAWRWSGSSSCHSRAGSRPRARRRKSPRRRTPRPAPAPAAVAD